ncbi:MAG: phosphoribosyltransferase family protein [Planctomycetia bacterium]|nr:phosphoribosyltransferase family protein [Planctomycetia bacterium]
MMKIGKTVDRAFVAFRDRAEAGRAIVQSLAAEPAPGAVVLAVPRGGVPVARQIADALHAPMGLIFVRKLPIPGAPEAGFGAVALDGGTVLNERLVSRLRMPEGEIDRIVGLVLAEVKRRARKYLDAEIPPEVTGKRVYLVDDGLATGYTMIAAAGMIRRQGPARMVLCVPVSPAGPLGEVGPYFDDVHCLIRQRELPFAVASFYRDFPDLSDAEVVRILEGNRNAGMSAEAPGKGLARRRLTHTDKH